MSSSRTIPTKCLATHDPESVYDFDDLFREFYPRIVALTCPVTGDSALSEDVAQETLSRLHARSLSLDFCDPIWPWLKTVAMHLAIDQVRRDHREAATEPHLVDARAGLSGADDRHWCEDGPQLVLAVNALPARQRLALALRYLRDEDPCDSATLMGLNKRAFEQLLFRARRNLFAARV